MGWPLDDRRKLDRIIELQAEEVNILRQILAVLTPSLPGPPVSFALTLTSSTKEKSK